jgi:cyclic beta-1,2-glucan synthetase
MSDRAPVADAEPLGASQGGAEEASRALARTHGTARAGVRAPPIGRRLDDLGTRLRTMVDDLPDDAELSSASAQWLLDNDYLVMRALREASHDMPQAFYRRLPRLASGETRAEAVATAALDASDGPLALDGLQRHVEAYQDVAPLRLGELWALPTFLRIVALERLAEAASSELSAARAGSAAERTVRSSVLTLHALERHDWTGFVEAASRVERRLRDDPAGVYARLDEETRDRYRKRIERLAAASGSSEGEVADAAVGIAETAVASGAAEEDRHVGTYLIGPGVAALERAVGARVGPRGRAGRWLRRHAAACYLTGTTAMAAAQIAAALAYGAAHDGGPASLTLLGVALIVPAWATAETATRWIVMRLVPPRVLPKLDARRGVPDDARTLIAIPALISDVAGVPPLFGRLERHYLGHRDPNLGFAILADLPDASEEVAPSDAAIRAELDASLAVLRARYPDGRFHLLLRERRFNPSEGLWMGWERKRGKLAELGRLLLRGDEGSFAHLDLAAGEPFDYAFVLTLDADTVLPPGAGLRLIGTAAHPLVRPRFASDGRLRSGYTVLQPRVDDLPESVGRTRFARWFSGARGVDLYAHAVSEPFMDLFGEGIYAGKGIYEVAAFERATAGKVPENAVLSHDLFEGGLGRAGLVSDVTILESPPADYLTHLRRLHRWIRGDWQLLPWLGRTAPSPDGPIPNPLSWVARWVLAQNLVRSLLPPALLTLFTLGWLLLPGGPLPWTAVALAISATPLLLGRWTTLRRFGRPHGPAAPRAVPTDLLRWLAETAFLPSAASTATDAVTRTAWRLFVSRRHLLRWQDAARAERDVSRLVGASDRWRAMAVAPSLALAIGASLAWARPSALPVALPLLIAWAASPQLAATLARPAERPQRPLAAARRRWLATVARRTWLYFERFAGPDEHWLPPDHFQEEPLGTVAHRTSPTNIGLALTTAVGAHDLGFVSTPGLVQRLGSTFATLARLERHRGHFLNWYDTRSLRPLPPRYVSTVDSGNLLGCLVAVKQASLELASSPVLGGRRWQGVTALVDLLRVSAEALHAEGGPLEASFARFEARIARALGDPATTVAMTDELLDRELPELERLLMERVRASAGRVAHEPLAEVGVWLGRLHDQLATMRSERRLFLPWLDDGPMAVAPDDASPLPAGVLSYRDLHAVYHRLRARLEAPRREGEPVEARVRFAGALDAAEAALADLERGVQAVVHEAERYLDEARFAFLYDERRDLFRIGYHVDDDRPDEHAYDLLASESRIGGFLAVALGRVPPAHWIHLGRPFAEAGGQRVLLSWSGTMFEYLMPRLLMRTPAGSLLGQACRAALDRQIAFGVRHGVPWGVSESSYARTDAQRTYQYRAFGVPDLALSHDATGRLVIAPYATLMALPLDPEAASANLERLVRAGALGLYGFYESLDYTPTHLPPGERRKVVRTFMAHHHGMSFLGICNVLQDERFVTRFHADPRVRASDVLLQEGPAPTAPLERVGSAERAYVRRVRAPLPELDAWEPAADAAPQLHSLSNGRYTVVMTAAGGGFSRHGGLDLTRWRADATRDPWGTWIYLRDLDGGPTWSAAERPAGPRGDEAVTVFHPHRIEVRRRVGDVVSRLDVVVAPDADLEIRRLTLANHGDVPRRLHVASFAEVALAPHGADLRHPSFGKLFVESERLDDLDGVAFRRRPRGADEVPALLAHRLVRDAGGACEAPEIETDRARFLGRHGDVADPVGMRAAHLSGTVGATLDPAFAVRTTVTLAPHGTVRLAFLTVAGGSRRTLLATADRYGAWDRIDAAFAEALGWHARALAQLDLDPPALARVQRLLSRLLYPGPWMRADPATLRRNERGQSGLWAHGISGDHPLLLVRVRDDADLELTRTVLKAHRYWREQGITVDVAILNERDSGYVQTTQGLLRRMVAAAGDEPWLDRPGGLFLLASARLDDADRTLLASAASAVVGGSGAVEPIPASWPTRESLPALVPTRRVGDDPVTTPIARPDDLTFDNGFGGFTDDGRAYLTYVDGGGPPAPWINVLATPDFGTIVSESGASTTWWRNSGENRLSPWSNDPLLDPSGEVLYLRDEETAAVWSPTPRPVPSGLPYRVRHEFGRTRFEHRSHALEQTLDVFVAADAPVKIVRLRLTNLADRPRRLTASYYLEWVLGSDRETSAAWLIPDYDAELGMLSARNPRQETVPGQVAFLAADRAPHGVTCDRHEFLGRHGDVRRPAALARIGLTGRVEAGGDPCAVLQVHVDLPAGGRDEVAFLVGAAPDHDTAAERVRDLRAPGRLDAVEHAVRTAWRDRLGTVQVRTPDAAMDVMLNGWLPYQNLACRLWGRSAFYQSSGAFGFRDQLQDVLALVHAEPALAREQLLRAARHQFEAGDVLHWWHPPDGRGVRTRISDDLAWLPHVLAHYLDATGDAAVLDEPCAFLTGAELEPGEHERYDRYATGEATATLYEHAWRALDRASTEGPNGLPLIGGGDWNDGMNRVGLGGRGESVWLAWFLIDTLRRFAPVCEARGDAVRAERYLDRADGYRRAVEAHGWDGAWYLRASYDDGTPIGSHRSDEARIDAIAQAWAVLSGAADPERARTAMASAYERLVRSDEGLVLLLAPPFDAGEKDPGYIKGYLPGVRENGGQYTHGAVWLAWAFARLGDGERAHALFDLLNPVRHAGTRAAAERYRVEPYAVAADVYGVPPHVGRGGWSWYTGSAGWLYRLGLDALLGIRRHGDELEIAPCIPPTWPGFEVDYRVGAATYRIEVTNPDGVARGPIALELDGAPLPGPRLPLRDDGTTHRVLARMARPDPAPASGPEGRRSGPDPSP